MTTDIKENIIPYIGETAPYISIPENIVYNGHKIETKITEWNFENEKFSNLIKMLASLGSCSLYRLLNDTSKEKIYFLGEKLRIRKLSYKTPETVLVTSESFLESARKGKSHLTLKDIHTGELLYSFEMDYYIITQEAFQLFYKDYLNTTPIEHYDEKHPEGKIIQTGDKHQFIISIPPFTPNQCRGHFENYPIVPFVFVANSILKEILNFLDQQGTYEMDSLEGYASKAIPTGTTFMIEVFHQKFLKDLMYFKCEIKDSAGNSYGVVIFNIKSKN
nr:hypothetical protein [uncultured Chryseobacterium sp.]